MLKNALPLNTPNDKRVRRTVHLIETRRTADKALHSEEAGSAGYVEDVLSVLGIPRFHPERFLALFPFSPGDTTGGTEFELQAAVTGKKDSVDLVQTIEQSNYYANILRRAAEGESPQRMAAELGRFLNENTGEVWENSWVRIPEDRLSSYALEVFREDLRADKGQAHSPLRGDADKFRLLVQGQPFLRLPISYLLKLALADVIGSRPGLHPVFIQAGERLLDHFVNDNTSPETHSFSLSRSSKRLGIGRPLADEAAKRFLLTQLLVMYANRKLGLQEHGQKALVYLSPHPPVRQRRLNNCISDSFYRELFMNPCLSGWDNGEKKQEYMHICHQALSRSHLNAIAKLYEAGIITRNLVVLPNTSNISLANNGTHISLGSSILTALRRNASPGFGREQEKHLSDLVVKIAEHFLPLLITTYGAAPYRLDFADFHPEKVLGFLPHQLDYSHLRQLWRSWKDKASIKSFGRPITPFGPVWLDRLTSVLLGLKGDYLPDFRLMDYLVSLLSTERSPALNGLPGSTDKTRMDLAHLGVFDPRMSFYLLFKPREFDQIGFCGFEARHQSLFESFYNDIGRSAEILNVIILLAFKYVVSGQTTHDMIPDDPFIESERRQIVFSTAAGIPFFFFRTDSPNRFMKAIIEKTADVRPSRTYPRYLQVPTFEYRKSLFRTLLADGADAIELLDAKDTMSDLRIRLDSKAGADTASRLLQGILDKAGGTSPFDFPGEEFNGAAEAFYREDLRERHIREAFSVLEKHLRMTEIVSFVKGCAPSEALRSLTKGKDCVELLRSMKAGAIYDTIETEDLCTLIYLLLITIYNDIRFSEETDKKDLYALSSIR